MSKAAWTNEQNTTRHVTPVQHRYCLQMVEHIASYLALEPDALLRSSRNPKACFGRHLLCFILSRHGLILEQIGRFTGRHHSTIHHSIRLIQARITEPTIQVLLESLPHGTTYDSLESGLQNAVQELPTPDRCAILAYVYGDLLGRRPPPSEWDTLRCYGFYLLQRDSVVAREVGKVLGYFKESGAAASLLGRLNRRAS